MKNFEFWKNWGVGLSDRNFANTFVALGILMARSRSRLLPGNKVIETPVSYDASQFIRNELERAVEINNRDRLSFLTSWKFPRPDKMINLGAYRLNLSNIDPLSISSNWESVANNIQTDHLNFDGLRIKVTDRPVQDDVNQWFGLFFNAAPDNIAAYIPINTIHKQIHVKWPLRLGYFPGNLAKQIVMDASTRWPADTNSIPTEINRENDNCDILIFDGDFTGLHESIEKLQVPLKCNMIITRGNIDKMAPSNQLMMSITQKTRCNGVVFLNSQWMDFDFQDSLVKFVENFSHNFTMDVAIATSFRKQYTPNGNPLVFLSNNLANLRLNDLVEKTITRLRELPRETEIKISPDTLNKMNIRGYDFVTFENTGALLETMIKHKSEITYETERTGEAISDINSSIGRSKGSKMEEYKKANRFIQTKTFIQKKEGFKHEDRAFVTGVPSRIRVRIGPPDKKWESLLKSFPIEKLPLQKEAWRLTVVLGEPTHIKKPKRKEILLPKFGPSTECDFEFTPEKDKNFEGRITIVHRGRIIQTAVLKIPVVAESKLKPRSKKLKLTELIPVRTNIGDLEERRQFDLALVTNHTSNERPYLTAIADENAWLVNLDKCNPITNNINIILSEVARSVQDYDNGLESDKGKNVLLKLVFQGCELYNAIVESELVPTGKKSFAKKEYLQIVSTKDDSIIPFEFIYDLEVPDDDAILCDNWKIALENGSCKDSCKENNREKICPLGFWGLSKVIERHDVTRKFAPGNPDHLLQAVEAIDSRSALSFSKNTLFATSERVKPSDAKSFIKTFGRIYGTPPAKVNSWKEWETLVSKNKPNFILALPHTEGDITNPTMEIGNTSIKSIQIRHSHVRPDESGAFPIVALLGCDTSGSAAEYAKYIQQFRIKGASVVISTIATVFGGHAAKLAEILIEQMYNQINDEERLGEIMRSVKRKALLNGLLMSLCVVAFGDADWKLRIE
ncbi:MAG: hypothetical protein R2750_03340 [Bacteroidales bacterium]